LFQPGFFICGSARQRGRDSSLPAFIPFIGAWINLPEHPHNSETEAYVAFAGPFAGTMAAWRYDPNLSENMAYRDLPDKTRYEYMLMYFGLAAFLAIMTYESYLLLRHGSL
jgi:hypothetical protein